MTRKWPAPAKINLFLSIIGQRKDGYHLLQTLFQFLDYSDILTITTQPGGDIRLKISTTNSLVEKENLIVRAAKLLQHYCWASNDPHRLGADIILEKVLPIGGGLGGGSSNAATTLIALNIQWNCHLNLNQLAYIGLMLGADVPVFIHGKAAFAESIGEQLTPVNPAEKWYLIAVPPVNISTSRIFNDPELKRNSQPLTFTQFLAKPFYNDCELIVRKRYSVVEQYLSYLLKYAPSRLTGTGACVFAEFNTEIASRKVISQVPAWMNSFIAKGVNISPLHRMLLEEL